MITITILTRLLNNEDGRLPFSRKGVMGTAARMACWLCCSCLIFHFQKGFAHMAIEEGASSEEQSSSFSTPSSSFSWAIGVRQVVYIALGIALYAILSIIFNLIQL